MMAYIFRRKINATGSTATHLDASCQHSSLFGDDIKRLLLLLKISNSIREGVSEVFYLAYGAPQSRY
jgi:hypothetical protein